MIKMCYNLWNVQITCYSGEKWEKFEHKLGQKHRSLSMIHDIIHDNFG
jgi:hypothetical protein